MTNFVRRRRRLTAGAIGAGAAVFCAVCWICTPQLRADGPKPCWAQPRPQDQLWLVSDRGLGCGPAQQQVPKLHYWRFDREQAWVPSTLPELVSSDDREVVTCVFAHGNRISSEEAFTRCWEAYRALVQCADERPIRFIAWSWPSDTVRGPINDARVKAWRTNPSGYYLAWFLDQLDPEVPLSLWGHSFGARIVTGALHLLGGGAINGLRLGSRTHAERARVQVALVAAALDTDWLVPGHFHGRAMSQTSGLLLVNNGCDMLLKRYRLIYAGIEVVSRRWDTLACQPGGFRAMINPRSVRSTPARMSVAGTRSSVISTGRTWSRRCEPACSFHGESVCRRRRQKLPLIPRTDQ